MKIKVTFFILFVLLGCASNPEKADIKQEALKCNISFTKCLNLAVLDGTDVADDGTLNSKCVDDFEWCSVNINSAESSREFKLANYERLAVLNDNRWAQAALGAMYHDGDGVPKDIAKAVKWFKKSAEQDLGWAQNQLGLMYLTGDGVSKDGDIAKEWFSKASEKEGYPEAYYALGLMYAKGEVIPKDARLAAKMFREAAKQGHIGAHHNLGVLYYKGDGVPQDNIIAYMWWDIAASLGDKNSKTKKAILRIGWSATRKARELRRECLSSSYKNCGY
tara:strand:- start:409 stop:1239 length:831 start_codon:yes stop_codon:yes gene_type:complete